MNPMQLFSALEQNYKLPEGFLGRLYQIESSGGKNLYNEKSGAAGPFQFIPSTARAMGLQNPNDLAQSAEATARLAAQNRAYLQSKGVENVDGRVLYLAHNQGADGAYRLLTNADKPADKLVGENAVVWNAGKEGQPAGEFASQLMAKYEGEEGASSAKPYSALGTSEPVGEKAASSSEEGRGSSRRETYALNTLMGLTKELEPKPVQMLPIPRLSYFKGGIVSLAAPPEDESESNLRPTPILFGGENAQGIDQAKLEEARRSLAEGRNPNEVYQQTRMPDTTGWYMGPDKKLRFEFSDKDAAVDKKAFDSLKGGNSLSLGDVLKHDDLFKYYPSAKDITVQMLTKEEEKSGLMGSYNPEDNVLFLSSNPKEAKKTILHESQHFIQSKEKFAPGGTTEVVYTAPINMSLESVRLTNQQYKLMDKDRENADKRYDELRAKGVPVDEAMKEYEKKPLSEKFYQENILPFEEKRQQYKKDMQKAGPFESYRRLSGETESRNVEKRMPMSLEQRAASIPTGTEEYPSNKQFVLPRQEEDLGFSDGGIVSLVKDAEDVRAAGRGRDTVLAHITPQEAALLKARGGRGTINPKTGLPEFEDDWGGYYGGVSYYEPAYAPAYYEPAYTPAYYEPATSYSYDFGFGNNVSYASDAGNYYGSGTFDAYSPSDPGSYGSYTYGYNDPYGGITTPTYEAPVYDYSYNQSQPYVPSDAGIDYSSYLPPDQYQTADIETSYTQDYQPEVVQAPAETYVPPEVAPTPVETYVPPAVAQTTQVPTYDQLGNVTGTETVPVPEAPPTPVETVAQTTQVPTYDQLGNVTGTETVPVPEAPRAPVTPVQFDLSKFTSPVGQGVSATGLDAVPSEPSTSPYIDLITNLEQATSEANKIYGGLDRLTFALGDTAGGRFDLSGPRGTATAQPVDQTSLAGVMGPQEAVFSRYVDLRPQLTAQTENISPYAKFLMNDPKAMLNAEKLAQAFGTVRPPSYANVPSPTGTRVVGSTIPVLQSAPTPASTPLPSTTSSYTSFVPTLTGYEYQMPSAPTIEYMPIPVPTAAAARTPNVGVLYDLANFLGKQGVAEANLTPYVGVPQGANVQTKTAPVPSFASISYPTPKNPSETV